MPIALTLQIRRLPHADGLPLPGYQTAGAAGMDLCAAVADDVVIEAGGIMLVPTGLEVAIPDGFEGQVRPRSGLAVKHGVTVINAPATIDADYRGELKVILINHGKELVNFKRGDRIAQLVVAKYEHVTVMETTVLADSVRAAGGFGHTGVN